MEMAARALSGVARANDAIKGVLEAVLARVSLRRLAMFSTIVGNIEQE